MAAHPVLTFHNGRLDVPEELQRDWKLGEGSELRVLSSSSHALILLAPPECDSVKQYPTITTLQALPDLRTPEWEAKATARKEQAAKNLDLLYGSGTATTTELRSAEREWELADDELDFGPFRER